MKLKLNVIALRSFAVILLWLPIPILAQVSGNLDGSDTICAGNNFGILNLSGFAGSVVRWEIAYSANGPWSTMQYTSTNFPYQNINQTTFFRVITQTGSQPEVSSTVAQLVCVQAPSPFSITTPTLQCINIQSTAAIVSNTTPAVNWEYTQNNWTTIFPLAGSPNTLILTPAVNAGYQLRAFISSQHCPMVYSNTITVQTPSASIAGAISGTNALCGSANACTLSASNFSGTILYWENAFTPAGPFSPLPGTAALQTLALANVVQSTYYRVKVQNGTCPIATSVQHTLQITAPSVSGFIAGTNSICASQSGATLNLLGNTGATITWEKMVNTTWQTVASNVQSITVTTATQTSQFRALVQNGICPVATSNTHVLTVYPKPAVSFSCANTCIMAPCSFSTSGSGVYLSQWQFGDGNVSSLFSPVHAYSVAGTYTPRLKCYSQFGCVDSSAQIVTIYSLPQAGFLSQDSLCATSAFSFISTASGSSGSISNVSYSFGDGNSGNSAQTTHSYTLPGIYTITQSVLNSLGCSASFQKQVFVKAVPLVNFSVNNACLGTNITAQNYCTVSTGFLNFKWHFGNGDSSSATQPVYSYSQAGTYFINLKAKTNLGCESSQLKQIVIHPVPGITLSNYSVCAGKQISIAAVLSSSAILTASVLNFGDGSSANAISGTHAYQLPGLYNLSLQLQTDSGCSAQAAAQVSVYAQPKAEFSVPNFCASSTVAITNLSSISSGSLTFLWCLNKIAPYSPTSPTLSLLPPGTHSLSLAAISAQGCSDTIHKTLQVFAAPQFSIANAAFCENAGLQIAAAVANTTNPLSEYTWLLDNVFIANSPTLAISGAKPGMHTIALVAKNSASCINTASAQAQVFPRPLVGFKNTTACSNSSFQLINTTKLSEGSFTSRWQFDSLLVNQLNCTVQTAAAGYHTAKLVIMSDKNCSDSLTQKVLVAAAPALRFEADTLLQLGQQVYLKAFGAATYTWYPAEHLSDAFSASPLYTAASSINYTLLGTSPEGCSASKTLSIQVEKNYVLTIYNVITLNANSLNDHFHIDNITSYPNNKVLIMDQNNQIVFEQSNYQNNWQARNAGGELLAPGTYYYHISFEGEEKVYTGSLVVMKD